MKALLKLFFTVAAVALLLGFAGVRQAHANPVTFSTSGTFRCDRLSPCSASGNSVTYGSGADTVTLTFTGVGSTTVESTPGSSINALFGQIQVTVTGNGASLPPLLNDGTPRIFLTLNITQLGPVSGTSFVEMTPLGTINQTSGNLVFAFVAHNNYAIIHGPNSVATAYVFAPPYFIAPPNTNGGVTNIRADVTTMPEPTTLVLLGTGLFGLAAGVRKRRRLEKSING